jgi:hypothetical protein
MSLTDPCNIAGLAPNKVACLATGRKIDTDMCNVLNPAATVNSCNVQNLASNTSSKGVLSILTILGIVIGVIILLFIVFALYAKFSGAGSAEYTSPYAGAGRFGKFSLLRKLFSRRR